MSMSPEQDSTVAIWKFPIPEPGPDIFSITMPLGAQIMTLQVQQGHPVLWALVDPKAVPVDRVFRIAGTGHPIAHPITRYVGTFQMGNMGSDRFTNLVFHVFEIPAQQPAGGDS